MAAVMIGYKYAFSHRSTGETDDRLKLQVSRDCGQTWNTRQFHRGLIDLATAPDHGGNFYPSGPGEWSGHMEEVDNEVYLVPNLRIRFEFESKGGNNVFLDDINVYGVDSLGNVIGLDPILNQGACPRTTPLPIRAYARGRPHPQSGRMPADD